MICPNCRTENPAGKEAAARILDRKTDIMTPDSIHKVLRQRIEAAAVPAF
jgi:hypothetical protein